MEITYQNSENECGVCVINSFYKYFYKKNIKNKILDCANITKNGINLFDFETLCDKFGMFAECFYTTHKELEELNHSGYFCLLINDFCPHYIICKKRRNTLEVLDSAKGKYVIKINELPKNSSLVFIKVNKNKNYINEKINLRKKNIFKTLNFNYLIVSLMLKLFFVTTAIFGSKYISLILDDSISNNSINNLITLTIFFAIIFSLNILSKYLINLFTSKSLMQNFNFYASEFINCIEKKDETFFNKINKNQIFLIDYSILSISKFFSFEITNLFTNIMCAIVCLCLIMIINKILLFVIAVSIVINSIIFIYDYKKKSSILNKTINNTLCIDTCISDWIKYLTKNTNNLLIKYYSNKFKKNYSSYKQIFNEKSVYENNIESSESTFAKFITLLVILISSILIIHQQTITVSTMLFCVALVEMFNNQIKGCLNFFNSYIEFKRLREIYLSFISVGNANQVGLILNDIDNIKYNGQIIKPLCQLENINYDMFAINDIGYRKYAQSSLKEKIYYVNAESNLNFEMIKDFINNTQIIDFLEKFNIKIYNEKIGIIEQIKLNLLFLLILKNKIIIIKDCLKVLDQNEINYFLKIILPFANKNNFIIFEK